VSIKNEAEKKKVKIELDLYKENAQFLKVHVLGIQYFENNANQLGNS